MRTTTTIDDVDGVYVYDLYVDDISVDDMYVDDPSVDDLSGDFTYLEKIYM